MADSIPLAIGWKEWIGFPQWGIRKVKAKIDTGAKTSVLNGTVESIQDQPDGTKIAILQLALSRRYPERLVRIEADILRSVQVRNTGGENVTRLVLQTMVRIGPIEKIIEFTVADRTRMLTPIILGRRALQNQFLVDASRKYLFPS